MKRNCTSLPIRDPRDAAVRAAYERLAARVLEQQRARERAEDFEKWCQRQPRQERAS